MEEYVVNKGVGRTPEIGGLCATYLTLAVVGIGVSFLASIACYLLGISQGICIVLFLVLGASVVTTAFRMNARYGRYGVLKLRAVRSMPRRIISRKCIYRILKDR